MKLKKACERKVSRGKSFLEGFIKCKCDGLVQTRCKALKRSRKRDVHEENHFRRGLSLVNDGLDAHTCCKALESSRKRGFREEQSSGGGVSKVKVVISGEIWELRFGHNALKNVYPQRRMSEAINTLMNYWTDTSIGRLGCIFFLKEWLQLHGSATKKHRSQIVLLICKGSSRHF